MMKTTLAVAAAATLATTAVAQAQTNAFTTAAGNPPDTIASCAGLTITPVAAVGFTYHTLLPQQGSTPNVDTCIADIKAAGTAGFVQLTGDALACAGWTASPPVVNAGANSLCPQVDGGVCSKTLPVCATPLECAGADGSMKCAARATGVAVAFTSATDPFTSTTTGPAKQATDALAVAQTDVPDCGGANAPYLIANWIAGKNSKEWVTGWTLTSTCTAKATEFVTALEKALAAQTNDNKVTVKVTVVDGNVWDDCKLADGSYVCAGAANAPKDCKSVLCNLTEPCESKSQCGSGSCKNNVCSGSAVTSTFLAVGAAALAAIAFF